MASEYVVLAIGAVAAGAFVFRDAIFGGPPKALPPPVSTKNAMVGGGDPRDFVARMKAGVRIDRMDQLGRTMLTTFYLTEETLGHLLRLSDGNRRGVCHSYCQRG